MVAGTLLVVVILLGATALRPYIYPSVHAAELARFDHVDIVSSLFLYKGAQGVLVLDKRNGNVWFIPRGNDAMQVTFNDPVFVTRIPFEKLDTAP
jgi:hypothetical protein